MITASDATRARTAAHEPPVQAQADRGQLEPTACHRDRPADLDAPGRDASSWSRPGSSGSTTREIFVEVFENVRGEDMFIIQSTSNPANDNLMELLIMCDALRRSSAHRITAVMPYFGYARQDRRSKARTPISAKLVANLLTVAGIARVLTLDLHAAQIQGFFDLPVDNLYAAPVFALDIQHQLHATSRRSPWSRPTSAAWRARASSPSASAPISRSSTSAGPRRARSPSMTVIGEVKDRVCVIVDDICDTAGTLVKAAELLMQRRAPRKCTPTSPTACCPGRRSSASANRR